MGWSFYMHYGVDFAKARDVERFNPGGARHKSPLYAGTLYYKLNNWVTFAFEQSLYETNAVPGPGPAGRRPKSACRRAAAASAGGGRDPAVKVPSRSRADAEADVRMGRQSANGPALRISGSRGTCRSMASGAHESGTDNLTR